MDLIYFLINDVACRCLHPGNNFNMAKPLIVHVKESLQELKLLQKSTPKCFMRIQMLILIKGGAITTKDRLANELGVSNKSVHVWRTKYISGGIELLLKDNRIGNKGTITPEIFTELSRYINSFQDRPAVVSISTWLSDNFNIQSDYDALRKYILRKFGLSRNRPSKPAHGNSKS